MNTIQATQQSKSDPKGKAIASLVVGVINIIHGIGPIYNLFGGKPRIFIDAMLTCIYRDNLITFLTVSGLISILGIILGKLGLRSANKKFAIGGIIFSTIGLLGAVFFYLFVRAMSKTM